MGILDLYDDDRKDLSDEFKQGMDYSDQFLEGCFNIRPANEAAKTRDVKSFEDAEQALTDTLAFLATDGTKQMDSNTVALLIKTISDSRTILSSGDLLREDASVQDSTQEKPAEEQSADQKVVSANAAGGGDRTESAEVAEPLTEKPKQKSAAIDEAGIKKLTSELEDHIIWRQSLIPLDEDQVKYLVRLKKLISRFNSVRGLLKFCLDFSEHEEEPLYPSAVIFLILVYFSVAPERYIPMFLTNPLYYSLDPQTNARRYEFDRLINYLQKRVNSTRTSKR